MTQNELKTFGAGLAQICTAYHYRVPENTKPSYAVWQELSGEAIEADNVHRESSYYIAVDYFTKKEFDAKIDAIQEYLDRFGSWTLESVQFENETNIIHYEWRIFYA